MITEKRFGVPAWSGRRESTADWPKGGVGGCKEWELALASKMKLTVVHQEGYIVSEGDRVCSEGVDHGTPERAVVSGLDGNGGQNFIGGLPGCAFLYYGGLSLLIVYRRRCFAVRSSNKGTIVCPIQDNLFGRWTVALGGEG
jgi:hypothetical protein